MIRNYIISFVILMSFFEVQGMENNAQKVLQNNNSPVFIKKVTNNSNQIVRMLKSHFFGYITQEDKEKPIVTLAPDETKEWTPLLPMPYTSVHFLAQFHAETVSVEGGFEDSPGSRTFNTCLLTYFNSDLVRKKLLKDHSYTLEIVLDDRKKDGQVQLDSIEILEKSLTK